jgi:hypothetical protein
VKKLYKFWDLLLLSALGLLGSGCILNPPPAEYGPEPLYGTVEPLYGVSSVYREAEPDTLPDTHSYSLAKFENEAE